MKFSDRQKKIIKIVKENGPVSGEEIADYLKLKRSTLRPDLSLLTMAGILEARPKVGYFYTGKKIKNTLFEFLKEKQVKKFKSLPVVVTEETSVYDAIVTLFLEDIGSIFVVGEESSLRGVISRKDFLKTTLGDSDLNKMPVGIIMTRMPNVVTIYEEETIYSAIKKMEEFQVDCLPVVKEGKNGDFDVVGRFSKSHVIKMLLEYSES
ncbi:helix-turn-helix transcriptional regulator [Natranaerofaba carboxydovora]|uniref:helix-turn-helix transcriptional regulator n=1 Tax=Natranaerofaba carboxydovora TaxID=2742683 RepID=UPI001F12B5C5|nr:helix-turn-helix transcriptional regulator [Natranaerofaba carboxydovora]UMZ73094.1 Transcriptional repressor CcpN [Natranaerofaba carboxydovora]